MSDSLTDYRQNVWTDVESAATITREIHWTNNVSPYEIQLLEIPQEADPSSVTIEVIDLADEAILIGDLSFDVQNATWFTQGDTIQIDDEQLLVGIIAAPVINVTRAQNGTAAAAHDDRSYIRILSSMTEQAKTASEPPVGYFQVDYETGLVRFNSADNGKRVGVSYSGLGQICCEKWNHDLGYLFGTGADGALTVAAGATSQLQGIHQYTNGRICGTVEYPAVPTLTMELRFTGTLIIPDGGQINVSGQGAAGGAVNTAGTDGNYGGAGGAGGHQDGGSSAGDGGDAINTDSTLTITRAGGGVVHTPGSAGNAAYLGDSIQESFRDIVAGAGGGGGGQSVAGAGAGGAGGAFIIIKTRRLLVEPAGIITAAGDPGAAGTANNSGGGGGGGGGVIIIFYQELVNLGTITAAGGAGGAAHGTGNAGGAGGAGLIVYRPV